MINKLYLLFFFAHTAFVNILPSLYEVGANMRENFNQWGQRRLRELTPAGTHFNLVVNIAYFRGYFLFLD